MENNIQPDPPHSGLVKFMKTKYYSDMSESDVSKAILSSPENFEKALELVHKNAYSDVEYDKFKSDYLTKSGDPFKKKDSTASNASTNVAQTPTQPSVKSQPNLMFANDQDPRSDPRVIELMDNISSTVKGVPSQSARKLADRNTKLEKERLKGLASQKTSNEFIRSFGGSPLASQDPKNNALIRNMTSEYTPTEDEHAVIQQNFSNLSPQYQTDVQNYLGNLKIDNPSKHAEITSRIGKNGMDEKSKAKILTESTNARLAAKARDYDILKGRKQENKEIGRTEAESVTQALNAAIDDTKNVIKQFPEEYARLKEIKAKNEDVTIKKGDNIFVQGGKQIVATANAARNSLIDSAVGLLKTSKAIADEIYTDVGGGKTVEQYGLSDRAINAVADFGDALTGGQIIKYENADDLQGKDQGLTKETFVPKLARTITDMAAMMYGSGGTKLGLAASGAVTQYASFHDDAVEKGLDENTARRYGLGMSFIQGALENVSPNFGVLEFQKLGLKEAAAFFKQNPTGSTGEFVKHLLRSTGQENAQEILQGLSEKGANFLANKAIGKDLFETQMTEGELSETVLLTTATTILFGGMGRKNFNKQHAEALQLLQHADPEAVTNTLNEAVKNETISFDQAQEAQKMIDEKVDITPSVSEDKKVKEINEEVDITPSVSEDKKVKEINEEDLIPSNESKTAATPKPTDAAIEPTPATDASADGGEPNATVDANKVESDKNTEQKPPIVSGNDVFLYENKTDLDDEEENQNRSKVKTSSENQVANGLGQENARRESEIQEQSNDNKRDNKTYINDRQAVRESDGVSPTENAETTNSKRSSAPTEGGTTQSNQAPQLPTSNNRPLSPREQRAANGLLENTKDGALYEVLSEKERANVGEYVKAKMVENKANDVGQEQSTAPVIGKKEKKKSTVTTKGTFGNTKAIQNFEPTNMEEQIMKDLALGTKLKESEFGHLQGTDKAAWKQSQVADEGAANENSLDFNYSDREVNEARNAFENVTSRNKSKADIIKEIKRIQEERTQQDSGISDKNADRMQALEDYAQEKATRNNTQVKDIDEETYQAHANHLNNIDDLEAQAASDADIAQKHTELYEKITTDPQYQKEDGSFDYEKLHDNIENGFEPDILNLGVFEDANNLTPKNETGAEAARRITEEVKSSTKLVRTTEGGIEGASNETTDQEDGNRTGGQEGGKRRLSPKQAKLQAEIDNLQKRLDAASKKEDKDQVKLLEKKKSELLRSMQILNDIANKTVVEDTDLQSLPEAEATTAQTLTDLDIEIARAEKELNKTKLDNLMNAGLPLNPIQMQAAVKLGLLKFKRFALQFKKEMTLFEFSDIMNTPITERLKSVFNRVKDAYNSENSAAFRDKLNFIQDFRRGAQDSNIAIKMLYQDLERAGVAIKDSINFAEMQELITGRIDFQQRKVAEWFTGKNGARLKYFNTSRHNSWIGRVVKLVGSYNTQRDFMYAQHALDFNARAREILDKAKDEAVLEIDEKINALQEEYIQDPSQKIKEKINKLNQKKDEIINEPYLTAPSGMSDIEANDILNEAKKDLAKYDEMVKLANEFRDNTTRARINRMEESGIISAETADIMRTGKREGFVTEMPNYLPFKVKSQNFKGQSAPSVNTLGSKIFGIQGTDAYSKKNRYDPIQMAVAEMQATQQSAINNEALRALHDAVIQSPFGENIKIVNSRGQYSANSQGTLAETQTEQNAETHNLLAANGIPFRVDGKIKYIYFNPIVNENGSYSVHPIVTAIKKSQNADGKFAKTLVGMYRHVTNLLRLFRTSGNIEFAVANPFRDIGEALTNISDVSKDQSVVEKVRLGIITNTPSSFHYFFNPTKVDGGTRAKFDTYFQEMQENGVMMSWKNTEGLDKKIGDLEETIRRIEDGKGRTKGELASAAFIPLTALSDATENTSRLSAYVAMRENGFSPQRSAYVAKNLTLNFEKKGDWSAKSNLIWMFSNVGIQGSSRMLSAAKSKNFWRFGAAMTAFAALNRAALFMGMDDDDEDKWIYDKMSNDGQTMFFNPFDHKNPIRLPKPYSAMRIFLSVGEGLTDVVHGKRTAMDVATNNVAGTMAGAVDPIGGQGNSLTNYLPTEFLKNYWQVKTNENWQGMPIFKGEGYADKIKQAEYLRTNPNTDANFDKMALKIYDVTGAEVQATSIEFFYQNYFKNAVKSFTDYGKIGNAVLDASTGKEINQSEVPALRRFYYDANEKKGQVIYGIIGLLKEPNNVTKEQIRYIESQLPALMKDKTISPYMFVMIEDNLAEAKDPSIRSEREKRHREETEKNIQAKEAGLKPEKLSK